MIQVMPMRRPAPPQISASLINMLGMLRQISKLLCPCTDSRNVGARASNQLTYFEKLLVACVMWCVDWCAAVETWCQEWFHRHRPPAACVKQGWHFQQVFLWSNRWIMGLLAGCSFAFGGCLALQFYFGTGCFREVLAQRPRRCSGVCFNVVLSIFKHGGVALLPPRNCLSDILRCKSSAFK